MRGRYNQYGQSQAKTAQHKNSNISEIVNPIESKFDDIPETLICTSFVVYSYP